MSLEDGLKAAYSVGLWGLVIFTAMVLLAKV